MTTAKMKNVRIMKVTKPAGVAEKVAGIGAAIVGSLYSIIKIIKLSPVEAMRHE